GERPPAGGKRRRPLAADRRSGPAVVSGRRDRTWSTRMGPARQARRRVTTAPAGPPNLERGAGGAPPGSRLRALRRICAAVLASVGLMAAASVAVARTRGLSPLPASTELSLS